MHSDMRCMHACLECVGEHLSASECRSYRQDDSGLFYQYAYVRNAVVVNQILLFKREV